MSSSNCCLLTCIQVSQEIGNVVWYSHLFENFPHFVVIHTVKGFHAVNEAGVDVFLELLCFFQDPTDFGNLISGSSASSKPNLYIWKFLIHVLLKAILKDFEHNLASPWNQFCWLNFAHSRLIHVFCDSGLSVHTWHGFICGNIMEGLCSLYFLLPIYLLKSIEYFQLNFWLESFEIK